MKRNFDAELEDLRGTYSQAQRCDPEPVARAVRIAGPAVFVGSGGALAVARLAADLHVRSTGELALATTPLEAATMRLSPKTGMVLFSARGKHPDAALALTSARRRSAFHLGVVTGQPRRLLPPALSAEDVCVATVPSARDGFLATNSVLAMCTALCVAHGYQLPPTLPSFDAADPALPRSLIVAVAGPGTAAVTLDLEARLVETGLASVQMTDYRNLAHGRHVGLLRNAKTSTVMAVIEPGSVAIAARTLALLPREIQTIALESGLSWPQSVLDLLVQSMQLTRAVGRDREVDPGQPGVATFGRKLYHLPSARLILTPQPDPVAKKQMLSGMPRLAVEDAFNRWLRSLRSSTIGAVVLDYDGTCCATWDRFRPPDEAVQAEVIRLLDAGVIFGFATGRGRSLHDDTRSWLPSNHWDRVHVGLYNGTTLLTLRDDPPEAVDCIGVLKTAADRLEQLRLGEEVQIERRSTQVSVSATDGRAGAQLLPLVRSVLARAPVLDCKAVASGHSVDLLAPESGKRAVLDAVTSTADGTVLAIGDQGQPDGNDFELLAATEATLSVDRVSGDPTRCWNLDRRGQRGPELLVRYLKALQPRARGVRFVWSDR